jgi:hypothetical protein
VVLESSRNAGMTKPVDEVNRHVAQATRQVEETSREALAQPWVEPLARLGFAAKGLVYGLVGLLALQVVLGLRGETTDARGALQAVVSQPFGIVVLWAIAVGLAGHVLWRVVQALVDPEHKGRDLQGLMKRAGALLNGGVYAALAVTAARIALGADEGDIVSTRDWTARLLAQPFGVWLIVVAGLVVAGIGAYAVYHALTQRFCRHIALDRLHPSARQAVTHLCQVGIIARGGVLALVGLFLVQAGLQHDAEQARGLGQTLAALLEQPYGRWLLGLAAVGLILYGLYNLVEARYHHINIE